MFANEEVSSSSAASNSLDEVIATSKFTRPAKNRGLDIAYEFTRDEGYLHQYYLLRSQLMGRALGWQIPVEPDQYDKRSHILIARLGNQVVGGARIIVRSPRNNQPLPLETDTFNLINELPDLELGNKKYCEYSRFVLLEEFQHSRVPLIMFSRLYEKSRALNLDYGFSSVSSSAARVHIKFCKMLNKDCSLLDDLE